MITRKQIALFAGMVVFPLLVAEAADPPAAKNEPSAANSEPSRVRYARTFLELARLDLKIAKDRNKEVSSTLPPALIVIFEQEVVLAEEWLKQAESEVKGTPYNIAVKTAEIFLKTAQFNYARALEANKIKAMPAQSLERLRLKMELAQLNLARAQQIDLKSPPAVLEFQLDQLREAVTEMRIRQLELLDRN